MQNYNNIPEDFFRELTGVLIYDNNKISYIDQLNNKFPNPEDATHKFKILPGSANRSIPTKLINRNIIYSPDISFPFVDLSVKNRDHLYEDFNIFDQFAVVLVSNTEMMMLGNDRFPLSISVTDNVKDDGSGNDSFSLNISGDTILPPSVYKIIPTFKVLFFIPPIV
ncbi:hypothetical protein [Chryseobacterium sp.]|uniref:hypothetical protein n=1 Tax=Chryseobacterium sp. TaxID=1871047 RepID=UPI002617AD2A|nr:hypothetical protein [Chryseobacterium sp.]